VSEPFAAWRFIHPDLAAPPGSGLHADAAGGIEMVTGDRSIYQAVLLLISTRPGERVMRPGYGCDISPFLFAPNDDTTAGLAIHFVRQAVERWEPRVDVLGVDAVRDELDPEVLRITLSYRVRATLAEAAVTLDVGPSGVVGL
jgi:Bacteriophage baseplate protein W